MRSCYLFLSSYPSPLLPIPILLFCNLCVFPLNVRVFLKSPHLSDAVFPPSLLPSPLSPLSYFSSNFTSMHRWRKTKTTNKTTNKRFFLYFSPRVFFWTALMGPLCEGDTHTKRGGTGGKRVFSIHPCKKVNVPLSLFFSFFLQIRKCVKGWKRKTTNLMRGFLGHAFQSLLCPYLPFLPLFLPTLSLPLSLFWLSAFFFCRADLLTLTNLSKFSLVNPSPPSPHFFPSDASCFFSSSCRVRMSIEKDQGFWMNENRKDAGSTLVRPCLFFLSLFPSINKQIYTSQGTGSLRSSIPPLFIHSSFFLSPPQQYFSRGWKGLLRLHLFYVPLFLLVQALSFTSSSPMQA